jgi:hypothetical protein
MAEDHLRLAGRFEVAVRHRDRRLFVHARDEIRHRVLAVVDQRLVQAAEARRRIGIDVLDLERLDHVDHEVRIGLAGEMRHLLRNGGLVGDLLHARWHSGRQPLDIGGRRPGCRRLRNARRRSGTSNGGTSQEFATAHLGLRTFTGHGFPPKCRAAAKAGAGLFLTS